MTVTSSQALATPRQVVPNIELLKLAITVKWQRPYSIPGVLIANVLRGALGITFRRLVCPEQFFDEECQPCPLYQNCAYGQLFVPTPPSDATQLRLQQDLPRPFIIEPPGLDPDEPLSPERLSFQLILFGTATNWLPFFITTIERLGHEGLGLHRMPFAIESVVARHPTGDEVLFEAGGSTLNLPRQSIRTSDILATPLTSAPPLPSSTSVNHPLRQRLTERMGLAARVPSPASMIPQDQSRPRIKVQFRTPMLLKSGSYKDDTGRIIPAREIRDCPPFGVLIRRLRDRLSALCLFFAESSWQHPDFAGLGRRADEVILIHSDTTWLTRQRTSTRTGQSHEISGFIGAAHYEFPSPAAFEEFSPLLKLGEYLHIGKNAPWGHGGVTVSLVKGTNP